jgi:hypothetical protein
MLLFYQLILLLFSIAVMATENAPFHVGVSHTTAASDARPSDIQCGFFKRAEIVEGEVESKESIRMSTVAHGGVTENVNLENLSPAGVCLTLLRSILQHIVYYDVTPADNAQLALSHPRSEVPPHI